MLTGLSQLRGHLPPSIISILVDALVLSHIRYCLSVYGTGTNTNLVRIQKVINYAAKGVFARKKFYHVSAVTLRLAESWRAHSEYHTYHVHGS